jgi:predicted nucleotide-binding protein
MKTKPAIFVGSSSEALKLARAVADELRSYFDVQVWDERLFELGEDTLKGLLRAVQAFDFAVLVISDDDTLTSARNPSKAVPSTFGRMWAQFFPPTHQFASPRDNVIFELGMFTGAMGRQRAFAVVAPSKRGPPKMPSDLFGNTMMYLRHETGTNLDATTLRTELAPLVDSIRTRFETEAEFELLPSTGSAVSYFHNFVLPVCSDLAQRKTVTVNGAPIDISRNNLRFRIVIPGSLRDANRPFAAKLFGRLPVIPFTIQTSHRDFPFWVGSSLEGGNLVFWDYPTILRASDEAVSYVTRSAFLSNPVIRARFEAKELYNFERSLRLLLTTVPEAAAFRDNIEIVPASAL